MRAGKSENVIGDALAFCVKGECRQKRFRVTLEGSVTEGAPRERSERRSRVPCRGDYPCTIAQIKKATAVRCAAQKAEVKGGIRAAKERKERTSEESGSFLWCTQGLQ